MGYYSDEYRNTYTTVLKELDTALGSVDPAAVEALADAVLDADQVFFVGVGRVLLSLQSIAKRLAHLGICTHYVGEITEPAITGNPDSEMKDVAEFMVRIPVRTKNYLEDEIDSVQPMTSLFEQSLLILGDTVAKMIIDKKQIDMKSLWKYHANLE